METITIIILICLLGVLTFQDFKSREISWFLIPLLIIGFVVFGLQRIGIEEMATYFGINFMMMAFTFLGVILFVSLKEKKATNIFKKDFGLGDFLFILVLTVAFSPINFFIFYLGSMVITILIYGGVMLFNKQINKEVPLAGAMSLLLIFTIVIEQVTPSFQFYQDFYQILNFNL